MMLRSGRLDGRWLNHTGSIDRLVITVRAKNGPRNAPYRYESSSGNKTLARAYLGKLSRLSYAEGGTSSLTVGNLHSRLI